MGRSHRARCLGQESRGRKHNFEGFPTSVPEILSSVALWHRSEGVRTSEELMMHPIQVV